MFGEWHLTRTEKAIIKGIVRGESPTLISGKLGIPLNLYHLHVKKVCSKAGCQNRLELVSMIVQKGHSH